MEKKTPAQQWHRATHRILTDLQHRCMRRTAPEEWNLATNYHEPDVTAAEFIRTFRSVSFHGGRLLQKEEAAKKKQTCACLKVIPPRSKEGSHEEVWLQVFTDLYGFRGHNPKNPGVFLLSPWEFLMRWECLQLPKPKSRVDNDHVALSIWLEGPDPEDPGDTHRWSQYGSRE